MFAGLKADLVGDDIHVDLASKIKQIPNEILLRYIRTTLGKDPDLRHFKSILDEIFAPYIENIPRTNVNQRIEAHKEELAVLFFRLLDCVDLRLARPTPVALGGSRKNMKRRKRIKTATRRRMVSRRR